jgi:hypothetical protein
VDTYSEQEAYLACLKLKTHTPSRSMKRFYRDLRLKAEKGSKQWSLVYIFEWS